VAEVDGTLLPTAKWGSGSAQCDHAWCYSKFAEGQEDAELALGVGSDDNHISSEQDTHQQC
jgi:hypothetical protein